VEFGEWLCEEVLKAVPHRHFVFSIPKILRRYFLYDRKLLSDLSRCGWESLKEFFKETVPEKGAVPGAVMVRYYGFYSNVSRGKRKKGDSDELIPSILEPDGSSKEYRRNWARLIQKIYKTDPLCCPRCSGKMKVISVIEDEGVIEKILKHLSLWEVKPRPPPKAIGPPKTVEHHIDYSVSQVPASDKWLYVDAEYPETYMA